ncbi:hypothetical protein CJ030_MR5G010223 [Morella rubra]|uniref:Uncharacterized protein n=1 Tax=Morella rubra TaxID=262757 RepID=A0A6A1VJN7_9ROSI|nr:hypothetical protein CJ030_MR5G010223 [Morella rubra]
MHGYFKKFPSKEAALVKPHLDTMEEQWKELCDLFTNEAFMKFPSKEVALVKPHPDTMEEQWKELCDLFINEAFMKRSEQTKINRSKLAMAEAKEYIMDRVLKRSEQNKINRSKLTLKHVAGSRSFQGIRACMRIGNGLGVKRMGADVLGAEGLGEGTGDGLGAEGWGAEGLGGNEESEVGSENSGTDSETQRARLSDIYDTDEGEEGLPCWLLVTINVLMITIEVIEM